MAKIKADILCELVAVSVVRSEFDAAEKVGLLPSVPPEISSIPQQEIDVLIAHTRTWGVFDEFAARIALHRGHLTHSLGKSTEALEHYTVASTLSEAGSFVDVAATLGRAGLFMGLSVNPPAPSTHEGGEGDARPFLPPNANEGPLAIGSQAAKLTKGMGGTLEAAGKVIQAATSAEILRAKWGPVICFVRLLLISSRQNLKDGLGKASRSQDNHLRALIMALVSSHYFHTAYEQAEQVLSTCEQLAAGLGAPTDKIGSNDALPFGNIQLGIWVSERTLGLQSDHPPSRLATDNFIEELYSRSGKTNLLQKQRKKVERLHGALASLQGSKLFSSLTSI